MGLAYSTNAARASWLTSILTLAAVAGCSSSIELIPKSGAVPPRVDLSGRWTLVSGDSSGASRRATDELVYVFVRTGADLKLTQTAHGLFVSFDRAVVEEYRFGEKRIVNVGPVQAKRVSGWEGRRYVVETLDENDATLREEYWLGNGGDVLYRRARIIQNEQVLLDVEQQFRRKSG